VIVAGPGPVVRERRSHALEALKATGRPGRVAVERSADTPLPPRRPAAIPWPPPRHGRRQALPV